MSEGRARPYKQTAHLSGGHSKGITSVAFNADGTLLASAGLDGTVCIWDTNTWALLDVYYSKVRVPAIAWYAIDTLVCGLADGGLSSLRREGEKAIHVSGFWAHLYPVEHLSVCEDMVASGAHEELSVWHWDKNPSLAYLKKSLPCPDTVVVTGTEDPETLAGDPVNQVEVLVTGVFLTLSYLIVTYLHHGIRLYNTDDWENVQIIDSAPILRASLSPNGAYLATSNLGSGVDIHDLNAGEVIQTFARDISANARAVPILFIHGGYAVVCGSTTGKVRIWYVRDALELDPLEIPQDEKVLALDAHYYAHADLFLIATGLMNEHSDSSVIIWSTGGDLAFDEESVGEEEESDRFSGHMILSAMRVLMYLMACSAVLVVAFILFVVLLMEDWDVNAVKEYLRDEL